MEKRKMRQWDPRQIKMKLTDEYINKKESRRNKEKVFWNEMGSYNLKNILEEETQGEKSRYQLRQGNEGNI